MSMKSMGKMTGRHNTARVGSSSQLQASTRGKKDIVLEAAPRNWIAVLTEDLLSETVKIEVVGEYFERRHMQSSVSFKSVQLW